MIIEPSFQHKIELTYIKLDIGSGDHNIKMPKEEWVHIDGCSGSNVDLVMDFFKEKLPFDNEKVDEIWLGDIIEHIPTYHYEVLKDWNRVLKIGGKIAGQTPNLHSVMMRYAKGELNIKDAETSLYGWHDHPYQQHYVTFTIDSLTEVMKQHGFEQGDFTKSPGYLPNNISMCWWLCFDFCKVRSL